MARGTTLIRLVAMLRAEIRQAQNQSLGIDFRQTLDQTLVRTQETLADEWEWPFLKVKRYKLLQPGSRLYSPPSDLPIERVEKVHVRYGGQWLELAYGIGPAEYNAYDSMDDSVRVDPVARWQVTDDQIEVWPLPATAGTDDGEGRLMLEGHRSCAPLVADDDTATLDDHLIVLHAAAELLAAAGKKDASAKASLATKRLQQLTIQLSKRQVWSSSVPLGSVRRLRPGIDFVGSRALT